MLIIWMLLQVILPLIMGLFINVCKGLGIILILMVYCRLESLGSGTRMVSRSCRLSDGWFLVSTAYTFTRSVIEVRHF